MNMFQLLLHDPRPEATYFAILQSWQIFTKHISCLQSSSQQTIKQINQQGITLWKMIKLHNPDCTKMFRQHYRYFLKDFIKKQLLSQLLNRKEKSNLSLVIETAHKLFASHEQYICTVDENDIIKSSFVQCLQKALSTASFQPTFHLAFQHTFRKHCLSIFTEDIIDFQQQTKEYITSICQQSTTEAIPIVQLKLIIQQLAEMGLLQKYFQHIHLTLIKDCESLLTSCSNLQASAKFLSNTINYFNVFIKSFFKKLALSNTKEFLQNQLQKLQQSIYFLGAKYCSHNILQIVLDYPDSHSVILVLKRCLDRCSLLNQLSQHLHNGIKKRLLIPGVITQNILNQYLNMLKVLQIIDPHGIVFQKLTLPIKNYLLKRNDTLRCIISHMTENGEISSGLTRDMIRIPSKEYIDQQSSDQNQNQAEKWQVLNVKENKMRIRVKYQEIDLATVLVNLYGSQQAFIMEYQNMLAEKLMSAKSYNIQQEIKNIELLKMRFGENALQNCNVIVKDVRDSRKNDTVVHKEKATQLKSSKQFSIAKMHCLAVSKGYWPINYENQSTFQLPQQLKSVFEDYALSFSKIKAMRKIHYHNSLGHVNLTLTFKNGQFEFKCLPIHAVIIGYFDEDKLKDTHNGISSEQLSNWLHIPPNAIKQKMSFWVHMGVIKQQRPPKTGISLRRLNSLQQAETVYYRPVDQYISIPRDQMQEDVDEFISKENTSMESHLKHIIEGLIISILGTNGPKSPEKIHLLLKTVYKTDLDYTYGENQTIEILKKMVQKKKILFNGEAYSRLTK